MSETASGPGGRPVDDEPRAILCPRCGLLQPAGPDCAGCGIVFAKLATAPKPTVAAAPPPQAALPTETPAPPSPAPPPARPKPVFRITRSSEERQVWPGYWVLLALAIVAAIVFWPRRTPPLAVRGDAAAMADEAPAGSADDLAAAPAAPRPAAKPSATQPAAPAPLTAIRELPAVRAPYSWYEGAPGYRKGVEEARLDHRPLAVYLFAADCAACREFESGPLRSSEVTDYLRGVVKVRLDAAAGADEKAIADQLGVRDLPVLLLFPPGGTARRVPTRLATPAELILAIQQAISP